MCSDAEASSSHGTCVLMHKSPVIPADGICTVRAPLVGGMEQLPLQTKTTVGEGKLVGSPCAFVCVFVQSMNVQSMHGSKCFRVKQSLQIAAVYCQPCATTCFRARVS